MVSMQIAALVVALSGVGETVLLDFHAPWCAPCRSMDGTVAELQRAGYPVRKVNIDNERDLAARHNVQSIPCFVMLVDGKEVGRVTGASRRSELLELFAKSRVQPSEGGQIARAQSPDSPVQSVSLPGRVDRNPFSARSRDVQVADVQPADGQPTDEPATMRSSPPASGVNPQDLILSSCRLTIGDPQGFSYGSGTIIDSRQGEALVLTCGHVFRDSKGQGTITVDLFGQGAPQKLPARLVSYDLKTDVGLVSIRPGVPVSVAPVAPKGFRIAKGDKVVTVGCNNGKEPTAIESRITAIDKFLGPPNLQVSGLPVQGRSGGGLYSADGHVIGVCNAADPADNEGLYAALATIHSQLDKSGLTAIYENQASGEQSQLVAGRGVPAMPAKMPKPSFAGGSRGGPANRFGSTDYSAAINASEQAAMAKVDSAGDGAEVICIVRSLTDPQAKSEVIKLDRASSAFLRQLVADREAQKSKHLTSLEVPRTRQQVAPNSGGPKDAGPNSGNAVRWSSSDRDPRKTTLR